MPCEEFVHLISTFAFSVEENLTEATQLNPSWEQHTNLQLKTDQEPLPRVDHPSEDDFQLLSVFVQPFSVWWSGEFFKIGDSESNLILCACVALCCLAPPCGDMIGIGMCWFEWIVNKCVPAACQTTASVASASRWSYQPRQATWRWVSYGLISCCVTIIYYERISSVNLYPIHLLYLVFMLCVDQNGMKWTPSCGDGRVPCGNSNYVIVELKKSNNK